jgi:hypothetical protein
MKSYTDEELKEWVKISEHEFTNSDGKVIGKLAIFKSNYPSDIVELLNCAVSRYVGDEKYYEFIDIGMCDPWTRIVISDMINGDVADWITIEAELRDRKLEEILKQLES